MKWSGLLLTAFVVVLAAVVFAFSADAAAIVKNISTVPYGDTNGTGVYAPRPRFHGTANGTEDLELLISAEGVAETVEFWKSKIFKLFCAVGAAVCLCPIIMSLYCSLC
ncbi:hypothetical protein L596_011773 [Steinernema carpocapsae]|uniref:Uncharacterized protein n=1 Tax=Steinernema carpocapsae TaxID=34508 RepID=A0A4U5NV07_STECR|nr:hypothetical protein L596_011773 [Steinernema carpocapsae]